ncbi:MAG: uroporphyrinogen-III C-methyltransferase, partial [Pseudomonadota bacterium]
LRAIDDRAGGTETRRGRVDLIGAGPGDPELLTFKAARAIARADVVLYDALVDPRVVALARRDAELLDVGKRAGGRSTPQVEICALVAEHAAAGKRVVRIKGGDPSVFGRAAEELAAARAVGATVEIIPGVTAASAAAAAIGAPLTARGAAASVTLAAGRGADGGAMRDVVDDDAVVAVYMAGRDLAAHAALLIAHGRRADTPCAVIENASRPDEAKRFFTLGALAETGPIALSGAAVLLLIGDVVALSPEWVDRPSEVLKAQATVDGCRFAPAG